jgi:hypothetical protein
LVESEEPIVVERRRCPAILGVTLAALAEDVSMEAIAWTQVTPGALVPQTLAQQVVRELSDRPKRLHASMVAMAGDAVLLDQILMKGDKFLFAGDRHAFGRDQTDVRRLVTLGTFAWRTADKRLVTGETVGLQRAMSLDQVARRDHEVRIDKREHQ